MSIRASALWQHADTGSGHSLLAVGVLVGSANKLPSAVTTRNVSVNSRMFLERIKWPQWRDIHVGNICCFVVLYILSCSMCGFYVKYGAGRGWIFYTQREDCVEKGKDALWRISDAGIKHVVLARVHIGRHFLPNANERAPECLLGWGGWSGREMCAQRVDVSARSKMRWL